MDSWKSLLIGLTFVALFSYCILNFGGILQQNNNVNNSIFQNDMLKPFNSSVVNNLNDIQSSAYAQQNASIGEQGQAQDPTGALILPSIFKSLSRFSGFIFNFGYAFIQIIRYLIPDAVILGVLFSILIIITIFTFWRFIKWGM